MVVWLLSSFLMLTLFVFRTKYFSFCSVSVVVSLSYLMTPCCFDFVLFNDQSKSRSLSPHAVCKSVSDCWGSDLCLESEDFSPHALLETVSRWHCVSDERGHLSWLIRTTFRDFHVTWSLGSMKLLVEQITTGPKVPKKPSEWVGCGELCNCDDGQPSCAILQYNN